MSEPSLIVGKRPYETVSTSCFSVKWSRRTVFTMLAFIKTGRRWRGWVGTMSSVVQVNEIVTELAARTLGLVLSLVQGVVPFGFQTHSLFSLPTDDVHLAWFPVFSDPAVSNYMDSSGKDTFLCKQNFLLVFSSEGFFPLCTHFCIFFVLKENTSCMVWPGM